MVESSKAREYLYFKSKLEIAQENGDEKETNLIFDRLEDIWQSMTEEERKELAK